MSDDPSPPTADDGSLSAAMRLALIPGVGPKLRLALIERFGSAEAALDASPHELRSVPGVGPKLLARLTTPDTAIEAEAELQRCREHGVAVVAEEASLYPRLLREISSPPGLLFIRGELKPQDAMAIAIVGTRHATHYGRQQAERLAGGLARAGLTVVSGLARGIDAAAHQGAMKAGGRTLAVLASGVLNIYPPEHAELAGEVSQRGALISENATFSEPLSGSFPQRNRLISGLSLGVIVVEAAERSGALITARFAMEQGREVFAVPGRVDSNVSRGCHQLIRDGARLVESVDDVLEELGPLVEPAPQPDGRVLHHPAELQLNEQEVQVLDAIDLEPTGIDEIATRSGLPVHRVLSTISVLEMRRLIRRVSGNLVLRR